MADEAQVAKAYANTVVALGEDIRILVNNAGFGVIGALESMSTAVWNSMFDTNSRDLLRNQAANPSYEIGR